MGFSESWRIVQLATEAAFSKSSFSTVEPDTGADHVSSTFPFTTVAERFDGASISPDAWETVSVSATSASSMAFSMMSALRDDVFSFFVRAVIVIVVFPVWPCVGDISSHSGTDVICHEVSASTVTAVVLPALPAKTTVSVGR